MASTAFGLFTLTATAQSWLTNGLISYYPFNSNANDAVGTNNGIAQGATLTYDRFNNPNSAYYFNGSSYISTPQYRLLDGSKTATISAWVTLNPAMVGQLLSAGDGRSGYDPISLRFAVTNTSQVNFQNCIAGNTAANNIGQGLHPLPLLTTGSWHQIVVVLNTNNPQGTLSIYIDGNLSYSQIGSDDGVSAFTQISYDRNMQFLIGALNESPYSTDSFWSGNIDDIRIYNRALSSSEVQQLYQIEGIPSVNIVKAVTVSFSNLIISTNYQLQVSTDLNSWTNFDTPFTATNSSMVYSNYWNVSDWNQFFFRLH
jgi:hypothetical protein